MVSTRQMSIVNGNSSTNDCSSAQNSAFYNTRCIRNNNQNNYESTPSTSNAQGQSNQTVDKVQIQLMDLPPEVIEKILRNLKFKNVCQLRLVCRDMDKICSQLLNSTFFKLLTQTLQRFQNIKSKMPRRESARRNHHLACESDIIETVHMRLTLLQMTFGKHIERKHCCFFPGEILDEVFNILHYIKVTPKLGRPYKVTDELFDLSTMAMEYFKEKIEPALPEIAYFNTDFLDFSSSFTASNTGKYLALDSSPLGPEEIKEDRPSLDVLDNEGIGEPIPQSNMVLRKRIKKIKQGMKRYNSQLSLLRQDFRNCKRKSTDQQKQISELQKQLAEQQKQTLEFATRLDENDKKNDEISRKFSTLLQELNKCKTELQYWRSKSPATPPFCNSCGNVIVTLNDDLVTLINQGVVPEEISLEPPLEFMPIASSSTDNQIDEIEEETTQIAKPIAETINNTSTTKGVKRHLEEPVVDTPTSVLGNNNKKCRRVTKGRSKKMKL